MVPPKPNTRTNVTKDESINLDQLSSKLSEEGKMIVAIIQHEFSIMKADLQATIESKNEEISDLKEEVNNLRKELNTVKLMVDDADAYERKDTIIISGDQVPLVTQGENCSEIVKDLISSELRISMSAESMSTVHRLGRKPANQAPDRRSLIVKLVRRDLKRELILASRNQPKPAKLFIQESLTPTRKSLLFGLRQMKRSNLIKGCNSYEGRIYAYTAPTDGATRDTRHLISCYDDLVKFCRQYVKQPLEIFLENWTH